MIVFQWCNGNNQNELVVRGGLAYRCFWCICITPGLVSRTGKLYGRPLAMLDGIVFQGEEEVKARISKIFLR